MLSLYPLPCLFFPPLLLASFAISVVYRVSPFNLVMIMGFLVTFHFSQSAFTFLNTALSCSFPFIFFFPFCPVSMKIVLMGAPGCGKGTQSPYVQERYGLCHLSTGDMLRDAVTRKTANGLLAKDAMDAGKLVSDDIVFGIVKDSIKNPECRYGYILDGFPRTLKQAQMMENAGEKVDKVIEFNVPDDVILERTSGRWIHKASGRTYHEVFRPPQNPGKDDVTGEPLYQRHDDRREVCEKRLDIYKQETQPLSDYYNKSGVYSMINADRTVDEVRKSIAALLDPIAIATGLK